MKINNALFKLGEVPQLIPNSREYLDFWKEQYNCCLNGYWVGGKWMPGNLYFYINFWNIEIKEDAKSKNPKIGLPFLRDIEWLMAYGYLEARGFSRFEKQTPEEVAGKSAREIMSAVYPESMGNPVFENPGKNIILVGSRGLGKSFWTAGMGIGYEYLFEREKKQKNQVVVGAGDTKYSTDLLKKVKIGLEYLPGAVEHTGKYYPPPFYKRWTGSLASGRSIENRYDVYRGGSKVAAGTGSSIKHISFKNNALAANGTRPSLLVFEEAGIFDNFMSAWDSSVETVRYGTNQFGTMFALGTGGDMNSKSVDLSKMFYDTETYNLVEFNDIWENKGKIGFFVPAPMGLNDYKDADGNSNIEGATEYLLAYRERLVAAGAARSTIEQEIQYRPLKPSEAFLISSGNIFPRAELQAHLANIENNAEIKQLGQVGRLEFVDGLTLRWELDNKLRAIENFPIKNNEDTDGAIQIWEHPYLDDNGKTPWGLYIAGLDPYNQDKSGTGSLGSCIIYKRFQDFDNTYDTIVAEYTARPETADMFFENVRKLLLYYNAVALYENEHLGVHQYFRLKGCTHLLADQPEYLHDIIKDSHVSRGKGIHMVKKIKDHGEIKLRDWLIEEYEPGRKNLEKILSVPILKELIRYTDDGNYDRVIAFMLCRLMDLSLHKQVVVRKKELEQINSWFPANPFGMKSRPKLFN